MGSNTGSINEVERRGVIRKDLAQRLQAVFGITHYRGLNYLQKWEPETLETLADELDQQAALMRQAASIVRQRRKAIEAFMPRHVSPTIETPEGALSVIHRGLLAALGSKNPLGPLSKLVTEESPYAYSFPIFEPGACDAILGRVQDFIEWEGQHGRDAGLPTEHGFNRRHVPLEVCKLQALADVLLRHVTGPLGVLLFPFVAGSGPEVATTAGAKYGAKDNGQDSAQGQGLDWQYSYVIGYGNEATVAQAQAEESASSPSRTVDPLLARSRLVPHTDDSELTLNCCLGREFEGGELVLRGLRNSDGEGGEEAVITHVPGRAVMHLGQHLHEVRPVTAGQRYVLIQWARNNGSYRAGICPCCLIHRRKASCVCDASWN